LGFIAGQKFPARAPQKLHLAAAAISYAFPFVLRQAAVVAEPVRGRESYNAIIRAPIERLSVRAR